MKKKLLCFLLFPILLFSQNDKIGIIKQYNTGKAVSGVSMHDGYLFVPLGADHGGGEGAGAFAFYDISNPSNIDKVFDSRDFRNVYHDNNKKDYVGDWAEIHSMPVIGDGNLFVMSEKRRNSAGFSILDVSDFPNTRPRTISRFSFPGVSNPNNYNGYSFSLACKGSDYVFAPTGSNGLFIVNIKDPRNPKLAKRMRTSELGDNGLLRAAVVIGDLLILTPAGTGLNRKFVILDITNPENPSILKITNNIKIGYQPFIYGSEIFTGRDGDIVGHDFSNPNRITTKTYNTRAGSVLDRPEYGFGQDDAVFIGHYAGLTKWSLTGRTDAGPLARAEPTNPRADDYAFLTPVGNLAIVTSDHGHKNKLNIARHKAGDDKTPPSVKYVRPHDLSTNVSVNASVGISFTDFIDPLTMSTGNFQVTNLSTGRVVPGSFNQLFGVINFVPESPLANNTTYQVTLKGGGIKDWRGNAIPSDTVATTFSTGRDIDDVKPFVFNPTTPKPTNENIMYSINHDENNVEYKWDFGDGSPTVTTRNLSASHSYGQVGNYTIMVTATYSNGQTLTLSTNQAIHYPILNNKPVNSSSIVFNASNNTAWNVNPDNNTVTVINGDNNNLIYTINVGENPQTLAVVNNTVWVTNKDDSSISIINPSNGSVIDTIKLPRGKAPYGIVHNKSDNKVYVSFEATGEVASINASSKQITNTEKIANRAIRNIGYLPSKNRVYVPQFISPEDAGKFFVLNGDNLSITKTIDIAYDNSPDEEETGGGLPNYLNAFAISPDGTQLYIPSKKDNTKRGIFKNNKPLTFEHTVRSMGVSIDLDSNSENLSRRGDFDNSDFATSATFNKFGNAILLTTSGSSEIFVLDAYTGVVNGSFGSGGLAPKGLVFNDDASKLYVHNFLDRNVIVFNTTSCISNCGSVNAIATVKTVSQEKLSPQVLKGKQLFYNSKDTRLAQDAYMSCASCHIDGTSDGRVWDITNMGEGLRNTIDLKGKGGVSQGRLHWSGNFDEVHDFENQIRELNKGSGLLTDAQFNATSFPLGDPKTGLSADLDALAAYVSSLDDFPKSPYRASNGGLTPEAVSGKALFNSLQCYQCHSGADFTNSSENYLYDVGTIADGSGKRLEKKLLGMDVPSLKGLWATPPYLHNGSAETIMDVLTKNTGKKHGDLSSLSQTQLNQLEAYLKQLDEDAEPAEVSTLSLAVSSPTEGSVFNIGNDILITVNYELPGINSVDYYINDELVATVNKAPFSYVLENATSGFRDVVVKANYGQFNTGIVSDCVQFDVAELCETVVFDNDLVVSYAGGQDDGDSRVIDANATLLIENDAWKAFPYSYNVTSQTVMQFNFKVTENGEIHGIGLDADLNDTREHRFDLFGSNTGLPGAITDFDNYDGSGNYKMYSIPVGQYYTGQMEYLFFLCENDANETFGNSFFSNLSLFEDLNGNGINDECGACETFASANIELASGDTEISICSDNGTPDLISISATGEDGSKVHKWVVTNDSTGEIIILPDAFPYDFEGTGAGICTVRRISYENGLTGLTPGMSLSQLSGCFKLSNPIHITRLTGDDCGSLSTNDISLEDAIILYPNPFSEVLNLTHNNNDAFNLNIVVYDLLGKPLVKLNNISAQNTKIDASSWSSGFYIIDVLNTTTGSKFTSKVFKQ